MNYVHSEIKESVYALVNKWHGEQRYGEHPYIYHLEMVANKSKDLWGDGSVIWVVSMLHDLIEDAGDKALARIDLAEMMLNFESKGLFTQEECFIMCKSIGYLTKGESITRKEYLDWLTVDPLAVKVKLSDSLCNLTCSIKSEDRRRISRYLETIKIVSEVL